MVKIADYEKGISRWCTNGCTHIKCNLPGFNSRIQINPATHFQIDGILRSVRKFAVWDPVTVDVGFFFFPCATVEFKFNFMI